MKVEVVHVKDFGKVSKKLGGKDYYIYCGRPSKLGNPYNKWNHGSREQNIEACAKDVKWLEVLEDFDDWVARKDIDNLYLGCYCAPKACHCDIIKARIDRV